MRVLSLLFILTTLVGAASGQRFNGIVVEAESGGALPGAHIFIDGTNQGDVAGLDGSFSLEIPERRPLVVIVSMIGFKLNTVAITPRFDLTETHRVEMVWDPIVLGEFVIEGVQPRAFRRARGRVATLLFSTTPAGSRCELENPEVLDIEILSNNLRVTAREPLRVLSPYLGYRVTVHGLRLEGSERSYEFSGRLQFEALPEENEKVERTRQRRRRETYLGSRQHFFRALVDGSLPESGFFAEIVSSPGALTGGYTISENYGDARQGGSSVLHGAPDDLTQALMFNGSLLVRYRRKRPLPAYTSFLASLNVRPPDTRDQASWITLPTGIALLDRDGVPFSDGARPPLAHHGYWSWQRVCDTLPADWVPPED
jgi:CarboxypepD_reg-like domain